MKMKNSEIINTINNLYNFVKKDISLPVRISYAVNKNIKKLTSEYETYDLERTRIMDQYDSKTDEEKKEANEKLGELLNIETDVDVHKIMYCDIEQCVNLSVNDVAALEFMIEE